LGVMETEWTAPKNIGDELSIGEAMDVWLASITGEDEKTKFRTRLEKGSKKDTTEIYISHRKMEGVDLEAMERIEKVREGTYSTNIYKIEEYKSDDEPKKPSIPSDVKFTEADFEVNAEIMRRLLVFLGMQDLDAEKKVKKPQVIVKAKLIENDNGVSIKLNDPFDRSWRRVSIALDMIGFLTEDRDRSKGLYYVTYTDLDIGEADKKAKEEDGWLDSIDFWSDDDGQVAEEETQDGDIRNKGRRGKKKNEEDEPINIDGASVIGKTNKNEGPGYGFDLDCLFSDECDKEPEAKSYLIKLNESDDGTYVLIENSDGTKNNSPTAESILNILYEYLR